MAVIVTPFHVFALKIITKWAKKSPFLKKIPAT